MKKNKTKLIAYLTVCSMFLSGCKMELESVFNTEQQDLSPQDFTISETTKEENTNTETTSTIVIEPSEEEIEPNKEQIEPIYQEQAMYATNNVNMCSSNTNESIKISELKLNDKVYKLLSCDNGWTLVEHNNKIGYVCNNYLEYSNEYNETEYFHTEHNDIVLTTATSLCFRTDPNTEAEVLSLFKENTELQVVAKTSNGWLLVKYNGVLGYVYEYYTTSLLERAKEKYPELKLTTIDVQKVIYSTGKGLNIRTGNGTNYEILDHLDKYESVRVIKEYEDWYFIMTNDYNFGFIHKGYTKELDNIYVLVDISEQRAYLYNGNELYYVTPVTTGKDSTPSDIGLFNIWYKGKNEEISPGYTVSYWMPYNYNMEGLHDAPWRNEFGTENYVYGGSNGCINMPQEISAKIYETVSIGIKVLVHK